jgi:hypothetical protein
MAINLQSPGIKISERDQIASVGSVGTTTGASVGEFGWGPIDEPTLVTSESDLVKKFGAPTTSNNVDFLSAAAFMSYSASQYVTRVAGTGALNANSAGTGLLIKNDDAYEGATLSGAGHWVARHAGVLGNSIKVVICENATGYQDSGFDAYRDFFDVAPGTSDYVSALGGSNDELHVAVIDEDGEITGVPGSLLEKFELVSKASDARGIDSGTNYYKDVINNTSQYIRWANHVETNTRNATISGAVFAAGEVTFTTSAPHSFLVGESVVVAGVVDSGAASAFDGTYTIDSVTSTTFVVTTVDPVETYTSGGTATVAGTANWGSTANGTTFLDGDGANIHVDSLAGGADGVAITASERIDGIDLIANKFTFDVDVIICGQGDATVANKAIAIAEARKDCVAVFSPLKTDVVANAGSESTDIATWADTVTRSTYGIADSNWKYAYDKYNDVYVWVPVNADVAGCIARVDANLDPWFSPAGYDNGRILNSVRLAWNPAETERDALYKISVNPVFSQPGRGTVLFGDKTFTQKKTTFSRINVRRLFITMQSVIGDSAGDVLFDQNDASTRQGFVNIVEAYLRSVQGGRGIQDFRVICDETNNPDEIVSANGFVCDIFVQPTFSVNFIQLNFTSVAGAAAFAEIGG